MAQVNLRRNIAAKQARGAAEEPVQAISTEQALEVEVGLLCYAHQVMTDASRVPLGDRASRDKERSSSRSRSESVRRSSGLGRASPSVIRVKSRPVRPIVSEENELLERVEQAPQWVKYMIAFQQQSEQRLQDLESAVKKAGSVYVSPNQEKNGV